MLEDMAKREYTDQNKIDPKNLTLWYTTGKM